MKKIVVSIIAFAVSIVLESCSTKILLPYEENTLCSRGKEGGLCGSLSDIYEYLEEEEN